MKGFRVVLTTLLVGMFVLTACQPQVVVEEKVVIQDREVIKEVEKEVEVEKIVEVEKEVKEYVEVEVEKEVEKEAPVISSLYNTADDAFLARLVELRGLVKEGVSTSNRNEMIKALEEHDNAYDSELSSSDDE